MNRLKVGMGLIALALLVWFGSYAWAAFQMNTKSILPVPGVVDFKSYQFADLTSTQGLTSSVMDFGGARQYYVSCKIKIKQWSGGNGGTPLITWQFISADDALLTTNVRLIGAPVTWQQASLNSLNAGTLMFLEFIDTPQEYATVSKTVQTNVSNILYDQECDAVPVR